MTASPSDPPPIDLQRNDVKGAVAWYRWHRERGVQVDREQSEILMRLQDEDGPLLAALDQLAFDLPR